MPELVKQDGARKRIILGLTTWKEWDQGHGGGGVVMHVATSGILQRIRNTTGQLKPVKALKGLWVGVTRLMKQLNKANNLISRVLMKSPCSHPTPSQKHRNNFDTVKDAVISAHQIARICEMVSIQESLISFGLRAGPWPPLPSIPVLPPAVYIGER